MVHTSVCSRAQFVIRAPLNRITTIHSRLLLISPRTYSRKFEQFGFASAMSRRVLTDVKIVDIEKRKVPSKHYVSTYLKIVIIDLKSMYNIFVQ